jgi:hypothetical protein
VNLKHNLERLHYHYAVFVGVVLAGCSLMPCEDTVITEAASPDGRWIATACNRSCGATTGFSRTVSIRPAAKRFRSSDPVFIADNFERVGIRWETASVLTIVYPDYARTFTTQTNFGPLTVRYAQVQRQSDVP